MHRAIVCVSCSCASGLPYTRIVTTALLHFLFDGLRDLEPLKPSCPDLYWVHIAMGLDRNEVELADVPLTILDALVEDADRTLRMYERGVLSDHDGSRAEEAKRRLERARAKRTTWNADIEDFGGKMEAIVHLFKATVPPQN